MKPPKARMGVLAEKLGILEVGRGGGAAVAPNDKKKNNVKNVLRTTKNINVEDQEIALSKLVLNPPHGEKDNFAKITVTLPSPIRRLLLDESHRRKTERDPNWSISVVVREALAAYLGTQGGVLHKDEEGREL